MTRFERYVCALLLMACILPAARAGAGPDVVPLTLPSGKVLQVEVMVKDEDRAMGLMFRPSLAQDHGLLFVFEQPDFHTFWMKNCKFPIDMVWLDGEHRVVHLVEGVPPCKTEPCPLYAPMRKGQFVVEMNAGQARREKAGIGAKLSFDLPR
jgi:uncharacterized membrane protein (UPF0127 family)